MTAWDSTDLLAKLQRALARPAADEITSTVFYGYLADAQDKVVGGIASRAPWILYPKVAYGSLPTLTTSDNQIFSFGVDAAGYAIVPFGKAQIYPSLAALPNAPWVEGVDYLNEGSSIRIPNNRTYSGALYYRAATQPTAIDATHQPALIPEASRELIVLRAVIDFGDAGGLRPDLSGRYESKYAEAFSRWMLVWKTQFKSGGALAYRDPWQGQGGISAGSGVLGIVTVTP